MFASILVQETVSYDFKFNILEFHESKGTGEPHRSTEKPPCGQCTIEKNKVM